MPATESSNLSYYCARRALSIHSNRKPLYRRNFRGPRPNTPRCVVACLVAASGLDPSYGWSWWMMVSNGNRDASMDSGWNDAVPVGRAYVEAAPDRVIWSTDWPHPMWTKRMTNDAEEVGLLYRYVDNDAGLLQKILVDNPARLHGFST